MNKTIDELLQRKSTRVFIDKRISNEDKKLILDASFAAPTAGNMQLYSIISVTNQELKEKLAVLCDHQSFIGKASWILIYCADYYKWYKAFEDEGLKPRAIQEGDLFLAMEDSLIAAQNAVTAAQSLGISSCYIGDIMENGEEVVKLLELPEHVYPATMLVFGYADDDHVEKEKPKRMASKYVVFEDKYQKLNKEEIQDMLTPRTMPVGYHTWMEKFCNRKHNSDFSKEMQRSARYHLKHFLNAKDNDNK